MITHQELLEMMTYDPDTGDFVWRVRRNRTLAGTKAGTVIPEGYIVITIRRKKFAAHRLAWFYVHGRWPKELIDHENNNPGDNRFTNLREANKSENGTNCRRPRDNTSGFKGVRPASTAGRWLAQIKKNHRNHHLGTFKTPEAAHLAYCQAAAILHGPFMRVA